MEESKIKTRSNIACSGLGGTGRIFTSVLNRQASNANRWLAETMNLYHGDCLEVLPTFPPASVEAIITDLPYGTTACEWDSIIPLAPMWEQVKRVLKPAGTFITMTGQPFTSNLIMSNLDMFKYEIIWRKSKGFNFLHAKNAPIRRHENIAVFSLGIIAYIGHSENRMTYNPQGVKETNKKWHRPQKYQSEHRYDRPSDKLSRVITQENFPDDLIDFGSEHNPPHPTQKPVDLYEYLIRTFTNPGETVLDICMGSGTTGVAAVQTGRNFIGIEKEQKYFEIASRRIAQAPQPLFTEPPRQPTQREPDLKLESGKLSGFE